MQDLFPSRIRSYRESLDCNGKGIHNSNNIIWKKNIKCYESFNTNGMDINRNNSKYYDTTVDSSMTRIRKETNESIGNRLRADHTNIRKEMMKYLNNQSSKDIRAASKSPPKAGLDTVNSSRVTGVKDSGMIRHGSQHLGVYGISSSRVGLEPTKEARLYTEVYNHPTIKESETSKVLKLIRDSTEGKFKHVRANSNSSTRKGNLMFGNRLTPTNPVTSQPTNPVPSIPSRTSPKYSNVPMPLPKNPEEAKSSRVQLSSKEVQTKANYIKNPYETPKRDNPFKPRVPTDLNQKETNKNRVVLDNEIMKCLKNIDICKTDHQRKEVPTTASLPISQRIEDTLKKIRTRRSEERKDLERIIKTYRHDDDVLHQFIDLLVKYKLSYDHMKMFSSHTGSSIPSNKKCKRLSTRSVNVSSRLDHEQAANCNRDESLLLDQINAHN